MIILSKSTNLKKAFVFTTVLLVMLTLFAFLFSAVLRRFVVPHRYNFFNFNFSNVLGEKVKAPVEVEKTSTFASFLQPIYGTPKKLVIQSIKISLPIVSVGVDSSGYLETPKDWESAGWYEKGAKPAENGNLLINAHYDDNYGRPAAFYGLKNIKLGDTVSVLDSYGLVFDYKVTKVFYVDINDPDRLKVFEGSGKNKPAMTLITCGGVWIPSEHNYSKRLVVNAELISR